MSEANVEVVRRGYEAFNRGDLRGMVEDFAPSFEYIPTGAIPGDPDVYPAPEGLTGFVGPLREEFDDPRAEVHELIEAGDRVLAGVIARGRGKQSGAEASWRLWHLWTLRDGKIVRGQGFTSHNEALEAAGLSG